ncbi:hypothetical protein [Fibrobacter sp. UBA4309]|uniref:hypothetical protein n=1 Tax=Fibrobacter sp. UBA4309 TaxID=1946537 RepID=UPI0025C5D86C|nr:hypothetical protein [Fibrobacter sp. UBA4309]
MKKKKLLFLTILFFLTAILTSCLFDSEDSALSSWLSDQGLPDSYKVQTLSVSDLTPISAEAFLNMTPRSANDRSLLGRYSNIEHDMVLDFGFESGLLSSLKSADSAASFLFFRLIPSLYRSKYFPKDSFPITEELALNVSWKLSRSTKSDFLEDLKEISDSSWFDSLKDWNPDGSVDTTYSISIGSKDSTLTLVLPHALIDDIRSEISNCRLQIRLSAPDAKHVYRFYGPNYIYGPQFRMTTLSDTLYKYRNLTPFRVADAIVNHEECSDCLVLHGGVTDSLVVELPSEPIMKSLSDFYGDEFPYNMGDGDDVRQAVVRAQVTFSRDDSQGSSELGLPIQVVVGTYRDSADKELRRIEDYKPNDSLVKKSGHPNMVFHEGDSLTLQVTYGMREFINKASDGRTFKLMMRMGYPVLQEKDPSYENYITSKGDTSYVFFSQFDYARYDFTEVMKKPATLKLWLASKRGED